MRLLKRRLSNVTSLKKVLSCPLSPSPGAHLCRTKASDRKQGETDLCCLTEKEALIRRIKEEFEE